MESDKEFAGLGSGEKEIVFSLWKTLIVGSIPFALNANIFLS